MILYKTLEATDAQTLYGAFSEAFSDYQVQTDMTFWKFRQMLQRRGYNPAVSVGAFLDGALVGFVVSGLRSWNGKATANDIVTGIVPEYRKQGIAGELFLRNKELLKDKRAEQYLLEVLKSNRPAVRLYQKQGFGIQREFSCFRLDKGRYVPGKTCGAERVGRVDFERVKDFWDFQPSWQNSVLSVEAVPEAFVYVAARRDGAVAGYGIIDEKTGDIPQFAVSREHRGRGIAGGIMAELIRNTESEKVSVLNVESGQKPTEDFLRKSGFEYIAGQYEMLLKL